MIELYQFEKCLYCRKVRQKLTQLQLDWIAHSAPKGSVQRKKLIKLGGKDQVPYLVDSKHNIKMYESEDIINYLEKTYSK